MSILRNLNLGIRFLLELSALAAFGVWGFSARGHLGWRVLLAIALPLGVAIVWGLFISPKARISTGRHGQVWLGLAIFLLAAYALAHRGHPSAALAFATISTISSLLLYLPGR